jgi:hypothetical protein
MKLILEIAIGYVAGEMLLELLGIVANWSGRALVRGFNSMGEYAFGSKEKLDRLTRHIAHANQPVRRVVSE